MVVRLVSVCEPPVPLVPDQLPDAVQEVALVVDQVKVDGLPLVTDAGNADKVTVGAGVGGGVID